MIFKKLPVLILIVALTVVSCGYYNPYVASSNSKPITLHRSMWANSTNELGLETTFYHSLTDWLRKTKLITLTEKESDSDYILDGKIVSVSYPEISYAAQNVANELRAYLTVTFTIKEQATGKTVWEKKNYTLNETLSKVDSSTQLQANKKAALAEIADTLSEEIYLHFVNSIMRPDRNRSNQMQIETEIK